MLCRHLTLNHFDLDCTTEMLVLAIGLNHLSYGIGSLFFFRRDPSSSPNRFSAAYTVCAAVSAFSAYRTPAANTISCSLSWLLVVSSFSLFLRCAYETYRLRPTIITTEDVPTYLHTKGPYRYIRHPFYTAYLANFAASALASRSPQIGLLSLAAMMVYYARYARMEEEKFKSSSLAGPYAAYKAKTAAFVPFLC